MSIETSAKRIKDNVDAALVAIGEKGVSVPEGANSDNLSDLIRSISGGDTTVIMKTWTSADIK